MGLRDVVGGRKFAVGADEGCGDHAAGEFAHGAVQGEDALTGIGERRAGTVKSAVIRRNEAIFFCNARGGGNAGGSGHGCAAGDEKFAASESVHGSSFVGVSSTESGDSSGLSVPRVMARMRARKPLSATIAT